MRLAHGLTGRANSVQALYPGTLPVDEKIAHCEAIYRAGGLPCRFKITDASQPPDLDARLADRGYAAHSPVSVQITKLSGEGGDPGVQIEQHAGSAWREAYCHMAGVADSRRELFEWMMRNIVPATGFASRIVDGEIVSVGLGVLERGWMGLYNVATQVDRQRQGHATAIVRGLMRWGRQNGAVRCYLQSTIGNEPAHALYASFGFGEAYRYWYRVKDNCPEQTTRQ